MFFTGTCEPVSPVAGRVSGAVNGHGPIARQPEKSEKERRSRSEILGQYLRYSHLGILFLLSIGLPTAGGIWLDLKLGTRVVFTLLGLLLGFATGIYALYAELYGKKRTKGDADRRDRGGSHDDERE